MNQVQPDFTGIPGEYLRVPMTEPGYAGIKEIEALGPVPETPEDIRAQLEWRDPPTDAERRLSKKDRLSLLGNHSFFTLLSWHVEYSGVIDLLIREPNKGVKAPLNRENRFHNYLLEHPECGLSQGGLLKKCRVVGLFAPAGTGKSSFLERKLSQFPQKIEWEDGLQIPYISVRAPESGSQSAFYSKILDEYTRLTGMAYYSPGKRVKAYKLKETVEKLMVKFRTSLLAIDEVQRLGKPGVVGQFHDTFTEFISCNNVSMFWAGTEEGLELLKSCEHLSRRIPDTAVIGRLKKGSRDWEQYVKDCWEHVVITRPRQALTEDITDKLYELSFGSADFVYELLYKTTELILLKPETADERITPELLGAVVEMRMHERYKLLRSNFKVREKPKSTDPSTRAPVGADSLRHDRRLTKLVGLMEDMGYRSRFNHHDLKRLLSPLLKELPEATPWSNVTDEALFILKNELQRRKELKTDESNT